MATISQANSEQYEDLHVHRVYEKIACHFSSTRYKVYVAVGKSDDPPILRTNATDQFGSLGQSWNSSYVVSQMELWE